MKDVAFAVLSILVWGTIAALAATAIMYVSQQRGWSRLNLPFLLGTLFTGDRHAANALGFMLYLVGGCFLAFLYFLVFALVGTAGPWVGAAAGLAHGVLLLTVFLPLLPYVHPRVASEYEGAGARKRLQPPGFLALHYGRGSPLVALVAHGVYGAILGAGLQGI